MPEKIKPVRKSKDRETADRLLKKLKQVERTEYLNRLRRLFLNLKKDIEEAVVKWKGRNDWDPNAPTDKLEKQINKLIDEYGADLEIEMDMKILPEIFKQEWNQKQFWASHFVAVDVRNAPKTWIEEALRTLPDFTGDIEKRTVLKKKTAVQQWIEALLPQIRGNIFSKLKILLFAGAPFKTFLNWLDRFFDEKMTMNFGDPKGRAKKKGVADDLMFHVGQLAWLRPLKLMDKKLRQEVKPKDVTEVKLMEYEVGYDTVTEYKDLVIRVVVLDERTCMDCAPLDGMIFEESKAPTIIHHDCRCYNVPYFPGRMGVLETGNYAPWFAKQKKEFQQEALGKRKYFLYENGVPLRYLRGTWADLSRRFMDAGLFSISEIQAIDRLVRSTAAHNSWIKNRLARVQELERRLKTLKTEAARRKVRQEISDIRGSISERRKAFEKTESDLRVAIGKIEPTKIPGEIPLDTIGALGVSTDEYLGMYRKLENAFDDLASRIKKASTGRKLAVSKEARKKLKSYFKDLPELDRSVLERDYGVLDKALENLVEAS